MNHVACILSLIEQDDGMAAEPLLPLVYEELGRCAEAKLSHETSVPTFRAVAVVYEASLRLVDDGG